MKSRWMFVSGAVIAAACGTPPPPLSPPPPPPPEIDAAPPPPPPIDAAVRPDGAVDAARQALGERYAQATGIKLYSHHRKHLGNRDGVFAPLIATADGGVVVIGTHVTPRRGRAGISLAVAARIDATGAEVWRRDFAMKGFAESEGGSAALVDGGVALFVLEYVNPAWGAVTRVVKLDDAGAVQWDWLGRGKGGPRHAVRRRAAVHGRGHDRDQRPHLPRQGRAGARLARRARRRRRADPRRGRRPPIRPASIERRAARRCGSAPPTPATEHQRHAERGDAGRWRRDARRPRSSRPRRARAPARPDRPRTCRRRHRR
jgi:hypothetical protein